MAHQAKRPESGNLMALDILAWQPSSFSSVEWRRRERDPEDVNRWSETLEQCSWVHTTVQQNSDVLCTVREERKKKHTAFL
jgi:hypothetical protein